MANTEAKARRGAIKDVKQGKFPEDNLDIPHKKKKKGPKPYKVIGEFFNREIVWHESETEQQAKDWIEKQLRSYFSIKELANKSKYRIEYHDK